jgi:hypothetical protein
MLRFEDSDAPVSGFVFPADTMLAAGGYLVVSDEGGMNGGTPAADELLTGFNIPWDQIRGGGASLMAPSGVGKDTVRWLPADGSATRVLLNVPYGTTFTGDISAPNAAGTNHSLARDQDSTDTNDAADWDRTSGADAVSPTFGARNLGGIEPSAFEGFVVY